jgi:Rieske Fe-S protein
MSHHDDSPVAPSVAADGNVPRGRRRVHLDVSVDSPGREGLAGTTPSSIYKPLSEQEQITIPPDRRPYEDQPAWRKDFPIDWPQDHYVARRDFTKFLVLTSFAFAVGQVWIGVQNLWRRRRGLPNAMKIASLAQLPDGATLSFNYPGEHDPCVLVRLPAGGLVAYSQKCTHLSCAVIPHPDKGVIYCPCHEGLFDLKTGNVLAGPPPRPLPRVLLDVRGGDVYATGIELRTVRS